MRNLKPLGAALFAGAMSLSTGPVGAADKAVQFEVTLNGRVDCESPRVLEDLPLSFKGTLVMTTDGYAKAKVTMTAAYFISFNYNTEGKLGAKAELQPDGTYIGFNVAGKNGLRVVLGYPTSEYILDAVVDGKRCGVSLTPKLKRGESQYSIIAEGELYLCSRFQVRPTSCSVKEVNVEQ